MAIHSMLPNFPPLDGKGAMIFNRENVSKGFGMCEQKLSNGIEHLG
jgi:hypothetical protein